MSGYSIIIFSKKYVRILYMSLDSYKVVLCAPISNGTVNSQFWIL